MNDAPASCVSCGTIRDGEYCAHCGERRPDARDLTLHGFLRHAAASVFDLDSRGYRSFRELLARPGALTAHYVAGRRRNYLSPLQLFLIANVLFFFAAAFVPVVTFDMKLHAHMGQSYGSVVRDMVRERNLAADTVDYEAFRTRFDYAVGQQARSLVILFVPMFALAIGLLRIRRREPAGMHLAFALHYMACALLLFIATGVVIELAERINPAWLWNDSPWIPLVVMTALTAWLTPAFRRAYSSTMPAAFLQALILALLFLPLLTVFRFIVFFTVFWSV